MFRQPPKMMNDVGLTSGQIFRSQQPSLVDSVPNSEQPSNVMTHNKNFLSSNILLNRILEKHNVSHVPMGLNTRNFYSNLDLMTIKWAASLNRRMSILFSLNFYQNLYLEDKCVVFFVVFSATILIIAHICGILTVSLFIIIIKSFFYRIF
jgi:hypothetical protein